MAAPSPPDDAPVDTDAVAAQAAAVVPVGDDASGGLGALRQILLGEDQRRLDELARRIGERQLRADDVAEVLPEAFVREFERAPGRLTEAVRRPIEQTLHEAVRRDPRPIADAIFPVIGPAIRNYITASIRTLAESLSRMIERGLSPRRQLAWRFKAWRAGMRFGDYVLQRTFVYRVEHVYLIDVETGLLMAEAHYDETEVMDGDAVSGMLSALQSFVLDSFALSKDKRLQTAEVGDFTLWAMHGPHALLACAIRGVPGGDLRQRLDEALESIHLHFGPWLEAGGEGAPPPGMYETLSECLYLERADESGGSAGRIGWPVWVLVVTALVLLGRLGFLEFDNRRAIERLDDVLSQAPGVVVTEIRRQAGALAVRGLRDPLAAPLGELATEARIGSREVVDLTRPYQSLEPDMVLRRLALALQPPERVRMRVDGDVLRVSGEADPDWSMRLTAVTLMPGIRAVDTTGLVVSDRALLDAARRVLQPPASANLVVSDGVLEVSGHAPLAWLEAVGPRVATMGGLRGVSLGRADVSERLQASRLVARIGEKRIYFSRGNSTYREDSAQSVREIAEDLRELMRLGEVMGRAVTVQTVGHTDGVGDEATNRALRTARAERVKDDLQGLGVPARVLGALAAEDDVPVEDPAMRRTDVAVLMNLSPLRLEGRNR